MSKNKLKAIIAKLTDQMELEQAEAVKFREETRDFRQEMRTELRVIAARIDCVDKRLIDQNTNHTAPVSSLRA